jgi:glycosyltransferase involved in cell wall biosynthesis
LLVPPRQVDLLVSTIRALLDDETLSTRLAIAARQHVERRFERETVIDQIEAVYRSLAFGR